MVNPRTLNPLEKEGKNVQLNVVRKGNGWEGRVPRLGKKRTNLEGGLSALERKGESKKLKALGKKKKGAGVGSAGRGGPKRAMGKSKDVFFLFDRGPSKGSKRTLFPGGGGFVISQTRKACRLEKSRIILNVPSGGKD